MVAYIGLMSGTSLDGVDGVRVDLEDRPDGTLAVRVQQHVHGPYDAALRSELLSLNSAGGPDELHRSARAARGVALAYADVVKALSAPLMPDDSAARDRVRASVRAIGAHGQTVRHCPDDAAGGYTVQLLDAALLAEHTGIDVIADFRSRDVAAGGQGAPLVPAFHAKVFGHASTVRAVLNLGGIANISLLDPVRGVSGFDCGPANVLLDGWCARHTPQAFDRGGAWAASAPVDPRLLAALRSDPYFDQAPPKSTGRDLFNMAWLDARMAACDTTPGAAVVQSTLAELTALSAAQALRQHAPQARDVFVCGGGAHNHDVMARLSRHLPGFTVRTTSTLGLPVDQVEACAFAWLAHAFLERRAANVPAVTGARGPRMLGALYPA